MVLHNIKAADPLGNEVTVSFEAREVAVQSAVALSTRAPIDGVVSSQSAPSSTSAATSPVIRVGLTVLIALVCLIVAIGVLKPKRFTVRRN